MNNPAKFLEAIVRSNEGHVDVSAYRDAASTPESIWLEVYHPFDGEEYPCWTTMAPQQARELAYVLLALAIRMETQEPEEPTEENAVCDTYFLYLDSEGQEVARFPLDWRVERGFAVCSMTTAPVQRTAEITQAAFEHKGAALCIKCTKGPKGPVRQ